MGADRLPDVVLELWTRDGAAPILRATIDGNASGEVVVTPDVERQLRAFGDRVKATSPRRKLPPNGRWPQVVQLVGRHGYVTGRMLAAATGMRRDSASAYITKMCQRGKLRRVASRQCVLVDTDSAHVHSANYEPKSSPHGVAAPT